LYSPAECDNTPSPEPPEPPAPEPDPNPPLLPDPPEPCLLLGLPSGVSSGGASL
jgi:hypothetical protein